MLVPKKALYIFVGVLIFVALGLIVYNKYFGANSQGGDGDGSAQGGLTLGGSGNGGDGTGGGGLFGDGSGASATTGKFDEKEVRRVFKWEYNNQNYQFAYDFYESLYNLYNSFEKKSVYYTEILDEEEDEYYGKLITESSDVSNEILNLIVEQGRANNLSDDQMVELVVAFVRSMEFDTDKFTLVSFKKVGASMNFPYETLYENKGLAFDKVFLADALLRALGYGTAVFVFDETNHMMLGVQCPMQYSNYESGYCLAETTNPEIGIGTIPTIRYFAGEAVSPGKAGIELGSPKIFQTTEGKEYKKIVQVVDANNAAIQNTAIEQARTDAVESQIMNIETKVAAKKAEVAKLMTKMTEASADMRNSRPEISGEAGVAEAQAIIDLISSLTGNEVTDQAIYDQISDLQSQLSRENAEAYNDYKDELEDFEDAKQDYLDAQENYYKGMEQYSTLQTQYLTLKMQN